MEVYGSNPVRPFYFFIIKLKYTKCIVYNYVLSNLYICQAPDVGFNPTLM